MQFSELAKYFDAIERTSSRTEITEKLAELFKQLKPEEIEKTAYLLQGRVVPLFGKADFMLAEKSVVKAVQTAFQIDKAAYTAVYSKYGDVGKTVEELRNNYQSMYNKDSSILEIYDRLYQITQTTGEGSQEAKQSIIRDLVLELDPLSARYIVRIPIGTMRLGFSDMTVLDAYSWMLTEGKSLRKQIEVAYHVRPDLGFIGRILKEKGIEGLDDVKPALFTPILMMRAERLSSGQEIIEKIGQCAVEPKYDGFRLQAHYNGKTGEVQLYTRGLELVTETYPDVVDAIKTELDVESIIFEGEALGFDPATEALLPFQATTQRKRKHGIAEKAKEIPLKMFTFDLLYLNGKSYIDEPYTERRARIEEVIKAGSDFSKGTILAAPCRVLDDPAMVESAFDTAITDGLEGIIAKKLDGVYQAGARGWNWIKFKRSYSSAAIDDTIDCVVMGFDYGKGKRARFGIGAFLAGVYDESQDKFFTVAKIGTGLTDDEWREMRKRCDAITSADKPAQYEVDAQMDVDVWVEPQIVVEIRADEITRSHIHTAGRIMRSSKSGAAFEVDTPGYALRFPRLERFREDKRAEDATSVQEIESIAMREK